MKQFVGKKWFYELEDRRHCYGTLICPNCGKWIFLTSETGEEIKKKRKVKKK